MSSNSAAGRFANLSVSCLPSSGRYWQWASLAALCAVVLMSWGGGGGSVHAATLDSFEIEATDTQVNLHLHGSDTIETLAPQPYQGGMSVVLPNTQLSPRLLKQGLPVVMDGQARFIGRAVPAGNNQVRILLPNVPANQMSVRVSQSITPVAASASNALPQVMPSTPPSYGQVITLNDDEAAPVVTQRSTSRPGSRPLPQVMKGGGGNRGTSPVNRSVMNSPTNRPVAKTITMPKPVVTPPPAAMLAVALPSAAPAKATISKPASMPQYLRQAYRLAPSLPAIASATLPSPSVQPSPPSAPPEVMWDVPTPSAPEPVYLASDWSIDGGYGASDAVGVSAPMVYVDMPQTDRQTLYPAAHPSLSMLDTQWYADQAVADLESKLAAAARPSGVNWILVVLGLIGLATLAVVAGAWMRQRWALAQEALALAAASKPAKPLPFSIDSVSMRPKVGWATVPKRLPFEAPLPQMLNWSAAGTNATTNPITGSASNPSPVSRRWVGGESLVPSVPVGLPKVQGALASVSNSPVSVTSVPRYGRGLGTSAS